MSLAQGALLYLLCCIVLQDFVHYVLKHSMVVLMTARDESTSFKIFSTLNGRGLDLAVIDKLKPELLQVCSTGGSTPWRIGTPLALSSVLVSPSSKKGAPTLPTVHGTAPCVPSL